MKVHQAVAQALSDLGVDTLFGLVGDGNIFMANSFRQLENHRYVSAVNEGGAVLMAGGYAAVSGRVGVASITQMAIAHTVPALIETTRGRVPVVVFAADTPVTDKTHLQNIDQGPIVAAAGAGFEFVSSPESAVQDLYNAVRRAHLERRAIVLDFPLQYQWADVEYAAPPRLVLPSAGFAPDDDSLDKALGIIASANRPVVLAGRGALGPGTKEALIRFAERIGAPVATTLRAMNLFRGDPFDLGVAGNLGNPVGMDVVVKSDCIVAFGAGLNVRTTDNGSVVRGKRLVQVDVDPTVFGAWTPVDAAVLGDCAATADAFVRLLDEADVKATGYRSPDVAGRLAAYDPSDFPRPANDRTVDLRDALLQIESIVDADRSLTVDAGRFMFETLKIVKVQEPSAYVHTTNIGSIGLGTASAIGAGVAAPHRPSLLVVGDGGFMFGGIAEFNSAVRNGIDLIVFVMNDSCYGAELVQFSRHVDLDPDITKFQWPEFAEVARSLGGQGLTVTCLEDFDSVRKAIANRQTPILVDVKIDPHTVPDPF
jgi:acetolactate synthase-1/2/3 large subunit